MFVFLSSNFVSSLPASHNPYSNEIQNKVVNLLDLDLDFDATQPSYQNHNALQYDAPALSPMPSFNQQSSTKGNFYPPSTQPQPTTLLSDNSLGFLFSATTTTFSNFQPPQKQLFLTAAAAKGFQKLSLIGRVR